MTYMFNVTLEGIPNPFQIYATSEDNARIKMKEYWDKTSTDPMPAIVSCTRQ